MSHEPANVGGDALADVNLSGRLKRKLKEAHIADLTQAAQLGRTHWERRLRPPLYRELADVLAEHEITFH